MGWLCLLLFGCVWCGTAKCRYRNCADDPRKSAAVTSSRQGRFNSQLEDGNETIEMEPEESESGLSSEDENLLDVKSMFSSVHKVRGSS